MSTFAANRQTLALAWPIALNGLLLQAVLLIDTVVVAPLGEHALAAMGLASTVSALLLGVLFALSNGTQILMAQGHGAKNVTGMQATFWTGLATGLAVVLLGVVAIVGGGKSLMLALAPEPDVGDLAFDYLQVLTVALVGVTVSQHLTVTLYGIGKSRLTFYSTLIETPVNILLSVALVHGMWGFPALGVAGAAIGTAVAAVLRACLLMLMVRRERLAFVCWPLWTLRWITSSLRRYLEQALPVAGSLVCIIVAQNVCLLIYARLGVVGFAAMTLVITWSRFGSLFYTPWAQAAAILVGQMLGRGDNGDVDDHVSRSWRVIFIGAVALAIFYALLVSTIDVFYPSLQSETVSIIKSLLPLLMLMPLIRASNTLCGQVLRAGGDGTFAFYVNLVSQWVFLVPVTAFVVLVIKLPVFLVFLVLLLDEALKAIPLHWRMHSGHWRRQLVKTAADSSG